MSLLRAGRLLHVLLAARCSLAYRLPAWRSAPVRMQGPADGGGLQPPDAVVTDEEELRRQRRAWAIVFNHRTENEGIYGQERQDGNQYIYCWAVEEDAQRYADMLLAQSFPEGTPVELPTESLLDFTRDAGHTLCLVPSTTVVVPPENSVEQFEWSPGVSAEATAPPEEMTMDELRRKQIALEAMLLGDDRGEEASG